MDCDNCKHERCIELNEGKECDMPYCGYCESKGELGCTGNTKTCKATKITEYHPVSEIARYVDWEDLIVEKGFVEKIDWDPIIENYTDSNFSEVDNGDFCEAKRIELSSDMDRPEVKKKITEKIEDILLKRLENIDDEVGQAIKEVFEENDISTNSETYYFAIVSEEPKDL